MASTKSKSRTARKTKQKALTRAQWGAKGYQSRQFWLSEQNSQFVDYLIEERGMDNMHFAINWVISKYMNNESRGHVGFQRIVSTKQRDVTVELDWGN